MLLLTSTSDIIRVVVGTTGSNIQCHASWVDNAAGTITPGRTNTAAIVTNATVTICAAPAGSTQRNVKLINITNTHATVDTQVTVQHYDGTNSVDLMGVPLLHGENLVFADGGWEHFDANGSVKQVDTALGCFIQSTLLTSASANFTTNANTTKIKIRGVAGGGGGGGCSSVASAAAAAGGGGAGSYAEKTFAVLPNTAYAYTCGAGGTGSSGAAGNNGSDSTFVVGATTVTCKGGTGGPLATAATTLTANLGGAGGTVSTNGDVNVTGDSGSPGVILIVTGAIGASGKGGNTLFGAGGLGRVTAGAGTAAGGYGAGGGGAQTAASAARAGGNATAGCWVVDEYT